MTAFRLWTAACVAGLFAVQVFAQAPAASFNSGRASGLFPASAMQGVSAAPLPAGVQPSPAAPTVITGAPAGMPSTTEMLTAPPTLPSNEVYPPGTVFSPIGRHGPITYELYAQTGPSILAGSSAVTGSVKSGWLVGGGVRTLLFNETRDAAWVVDLGVSYTFNGGKGFGSPLDIRNGSLKFSNPSDDSTISLAVQGIRRTTFNFAIGRDWWLNGPGAVGFETNNNWRIGTDVGGRYGTGSVDFNPIGDPTGYRRNRSMLHGVFVGGHVDWERPFQAFTAFASLRTEWSYTWTNLLPPNNSDFMDVNILFSLGLRY